MPRVFVVDDETGEIRCDDPSCNVTQCGQCNKEQNKRKRQKKAAEEKEAADRTATAAARQFEAQGGIFDFTENSGATACSTNAGRVLQQEQLPACAGAAPEQDAQAQLLAEQEREQTAAEEEDRMARLVYEEDVRQTAAKAAATTAAGQLGKGAKAPKAPRKRKEQGATFSVRVPQIPATGAALPGDTAVTSGDGDATEDDTHKTKWNSVTRTMFYKCIQNKDPFHSKSKEATWDEIASAMHNSTKHLTKEDDGDFRVYSSGKTLNVFYTRCKAREKAAAANMGASGQAGEVREDVTKEKREERAQLQQCMELEKSAEGCKQAKRAANQSFEGLAKGEVNDAIISCCKDNEPVRIKAIKVLASRLREAKMRKMSFEASNKGATYTYTSLDMENFRMWGDLKKMDSTLPEDPTSDAGGDAGTATAARGGSLAAAITVLADRVATTTPSMAPEAFAEAFFRAKRAHESASRPTLAQKYAAVDADVAAGTINQQQGIFYKSKITEEHYRFNY